MYIHNLGGFMIKGREEILKELKDYGFDRWTIYYADLLGKAISYFDWVAFQKKRIYVKFVMKASRRTKKYNFIASYNEGKKKDGGEECYCIRVPQLKRSFQDRYRSLLKHFKYKPKKRYLERPRKTVIQEVVIIAAHEVRHRIQFNMNIKLFTHRRKKGLSTRVEKRIHRFLSILLEEDLRLAKKKPRSYQKYLALGIEFDAKFIESLMLCFIGRRHIFGKDCHLLKDQEFISKVREILLHQPAQDKI